MKKIKYLKTGVVIFFLFIVFPGKIAFANFMILPLIVINFFLMLGIETMDFYSIKELFVSAITISSVFFIFSRKKFIVFSSIFTQYSYLIYTFNTKYLNYWYYTIPTSVYTILSLILIIYLVFEKKEINPKKQTL